ncbi:MULTISPECIES: IPTL-CTERM sorting domain-containing protein [Delftia]|nr:MULTISPECIES: IPTL-CTERM sorting domain-containing protein [Delftia]MDH0848847.1 IPTL-CTERM sorting domain-containing protein [Delftia tsuruhatensis]WEL96726.1 IPTL-CTERM sorting domain-containing protein [Delftia tsuruhatensis]WQM80600.1 IPTL-CTERM sorting domain-containing protein [Delftia tsuruhatensis]
MATEQVAAVNNAMCASLFSETSQQVSHSGESDTCLGTYEMPDNGVSVAWTGAPVQNQNVMSWHREAVHPALSLTHSISPAGQVQAGQAVRYTITVRNTGTVAATQAQIADSLPAGLERATWICTPGAGTPCPVASGSGSLAVTVPVFAAGDSLVFTVMASVANPAPATITNVATVDAGDPSVQCMQAGQVVGTVPCMASASINTVAAPPGGGQVTPVPTLQHTALVVLSLLAAAIGWMGLGRRQRVGAGR